MDATTLWLIAGVILLVATVLVGFVAVGRRRALRTGEQPPSLESPPRGWESRPRTPVMHLPRPG